MKLTTRLKQRLAPYPGLQTLGWFVWMCLRPPVLVRWVRHEAFRRRCYRRFRSGEHRITKQFCGHQCHYEAVSAKNYWHLSMASQHEDSFMDQVLADCVKTAMVVLDVGGHTGMWSVPLAKNVGQTGRVYVFEPELEGFTAIGRNAALNNLSNIIPLRMAVSDTTGTGRFYVRPEKDTHSLFVNTLAPSPTGVQEVHEVEVSTIDDLVAREKIPMPSFVKIDTEGAELKVLDGMTRSAPHVDYVLVEVHAEELQLQGVRDPNAAVNDKLAALGFGNRQYVDTVHILATRSPLAPR